MWGDSSLFWFAFLRQWQPTPVLSPGKSHGRRSLVGCTMGSLRVLHDWAISLSLFLSFIGEGNGNPLQCSCLEKPRDRGAWWAAIYGVTQSRTRLKRLSSSSSQVYLDFLLLHSSLLWWKGHLSGISFGRSCRSLEPFNFRFFSISGWSIDLDYCDIEWFALEMNRDRCVIF